MKHLETKPVSERQSSVLAMLTYTVSTVYVSMGYLYK